MIHLSDLIAAYLFFGGSGSGAIFLSLVFEWLDSASRNKNGKRRPLLVQDGIARRSFAVALALLILGAVCLLLDLERPDRAYLLFFKPTASYISIGTYLLATLIACCFILMAQTRFPQFRFLVPASKVVGAITSVGVMAYTGVFLGSMGSVPLWNSWLLPVLFVASSLASGTAILLACSSLSSSFARHDLERKLAGFDLILTVTQAVVIAFLMQEACLHESGITSVQDLIFGSWSAVFVGGYLVVGLAISAVLDAMVLTKQQYAWIGGATAAAVLAGCFCLRLSLVGAGIHIALDGIGI